MTELDFDEGEVFSDESKEPEETSTEKGHAIDKASGGGGLESNYFDICWEEEHSEPAPCKSAKSVTENHLHSDDASFVSEKSFANAGPVRHIYTRPFCIVYGTPANQALRLAIRDLAVYIGNSHAAAHSTTVKVMSDLEYRATAQAKRPVLANVMFIGGPSMNKIMGLVCKDIKHNSTTASINTSTSASTALPLVCHLPSSLSFPSTSGNSDHYEFSFRESWYSAADQGIIFTLPLYRPPPAPASAPNLSTVPRASVGGTPPVLPIPTVETAIGSTAMAVCIHANSAIGYLHMSRLAWPVVPPMVRAPFATYLPDFMVLGGQVWELGLGGALAAGYWDSEWNPHTAQLYENNIPLR